MTRRRLIFALMLLLGGDAYIAHALFAPPVVRVEALVWGGGGARALLVRAGGANLLLGAGPDASTLRALGERLAPWERHVGALVILDTSTREEGGAPFVLARYRPAVLLRPEALGAPTREAALAAAASAAGTRITPVEAGARLILHYRSLALPLSASTTPGVYRP